MKNDKKVFFLIEAVLGIMVVVLAFLMLQEKNGKDLAKVSIILQNSEDNQWAGFKYGLKMAAEDHGIEMSVVTTEGAWNAADEMDLIEAEIEHGADAVIVQPAPGAETEKALKRFRRKSLSCWWGRRRPRKEMTRNYRSQSRIITQWERLWHRSC